eukprot:scaffold192203_cov26-Tisochrysis_lutea.AAC.1
MSQDVESKDAKAGPQLKQHEGRLAVGRARPAGSAPEASGTFSEQDAKDRAQSDGEGGEVLCSTLTEPNAAIGVVAPLAVEERVVHELAEGVRTLG